MVQLVLVHPAAQQVLALLAFQAAHLPQVVQEFRDLQDHPGILDAQEDLSVPVDTANMAVAQKLVQECMTHSVLFPAVQELHQDLGHRGGRAVLDRR